MTRSTTALLARIEREKHAAAQSERDDRLAQARGERQRIHAPKWAVDHLMSVGALTPDQHTAAHRYASALERALGGSGGGYERVDGGDNDPHARLWDMAVSAQTARAVRGFVLASGQRRPTTKPMLEALFSFPHPSMSMLRVRRSGAEVERQVCNVVDLIEQAFQVLDAGYGRGA